MPQIPQTLILLPQGFWGTADWRMPGTSLTCLSANRTAYAPCPDNAAWRLASRVMGLPMHVRGPAVSKTVSESGAVSKTVSEAAGGGKGEAMRPYLQLPTDPRAEVAEDYHAKGVMGQV